MSDFSPLAQWGVPGFIIAILAGTVAYLYKENRRLQHARINDLKEYQKKSNDLFDEYRHQQELWLSKIQAARGQG